MSDSPANLSTNAPDRPLVLSREGEAQRDLGTTQVQSKTGGLLVAAFLMLLCAGVISAQFFPKNHVGEGLFDVFSRQDAPSISPSGTSNAWDIAASIPTPAMTRAFEKAMEERSSLVAALRPPAQAFLSSVLRAGNEQVVIGAEGWLFYRRDLDYVNGRSFMDPEVQFARSRKDGHATSPLAAIEDFNSQLKARGIRLLLLPVPVKPCLQSQQISGSARGEQRWVIKQNVGYSTFVAKLMELGIEVIATDQLLLERALRTNEDQYLKTDTHWSPAAMEAVAENLARHLGAVPPTRESSENKTVTAHGDTVALLGLPPSQVQFREQTVQIHPISAGNNLWKPSPKAEVLLLGDSFSNIYSLGAMGWGEGAGLAEHLSSTLGKPVDAILQNSDGAFATRQILQREMAAGRDRLKEKKVVIWEFAVRELAFGDWKLLTLALGERSKPSFYSPEAQRKVRIEGTVSQLSSIPRPGNVPYKEHIACMQLVDVKTPEADSAAGRECLVYTWSMKDQKATAAAKLRVGDRVTMEVQPWEDVVETNEKFQRSELDGPALLAEPFTWSDSVERSGGKAFTGTMQ